MKPWRVSQGLALILIAGVISPCALYAEPIAVDARPIVLNPHAPGQTRIGALVYRGGLNLSSSEHRFGGFSALGVSADGKRMISLSDRGSRLSADLVYDASGNLSGLHRTDLSSLAGLDGRTLASKNQADAESMSPGVDGEIIVSFERQHRIWRYLPGQTLPQPLPPPAGLNRLDSNNGIEALTLLDDGRLLAISEGVEDAKNAIAWVSDRSGWSPLTYGLTGGFRVTGAATHPDGTVYLLERYYTLREGVAVRLVRLASHLITPGAELRGVTLAELRSPLHVDNFEGIDVRRTPDNRTFVYLISDDNFNILQSTLLMMFEVLPK